jgi:hypothetical protein
MKQGSWMSWDGMVFDCHPSPAEKVQLTRCLLDLRDRIEVDAVQENTAGGEEAPPPAEQKNANPEEAQPPVVLLPAVVDVKKNGHGLRITAKRGRKAQAEEIGVPEPATKRKGRYNIERPIHKQALAYYLALGPSRTLAQVAQNFKRKQSIINAWSASFKWSERIKALESRDKATLFQETAMDLLLTLLQSFSVRDEKGQMVLTAGEKSVVERLKLAIDGFTRLRADAREGDPGNGDGAGRGDRKKGPPKGVMVNVIIKK